MYRSRKNAVLVATAGLFALSLAPAALGAEASFEPIVEEAAIPEAEAVAQDGGADGVPAVDPSLQVAEEIADTSLQSDGEPHGPSPSPAVPAAQVQDGWQKSGDTWYYYQGGQMLTGWVKSGGRWYYLDRRSGAMLTGWQMVGGSWYYLGVDGAMRTGWQKIAGTWYFLNPDGTMATGWISSGGSWYYLKPSGAMAVGWQKVGGCWYFLGDDGAMRTGWVRSGTSWYYLKGSGAMATGWQKAGGRWYLLDGSGRMLTGWQRAGGSWYHLSSGGAMDTGWLKSGSSWYYLKPSGAMATGWQKVGSNWYYFSSSGSMVTGLLTLGDNTYLFGNDGALRSNGGNGDEAATAKHTVTFMIPGEGWDQVTVEHGGAASPSAPYLEGIARMAENMGCTFDGFDADFSHVTSDMTVNPILTPKPADETSPAEDTEPVDEHADMVWVEERGHFIYYALMHYDGTILSGDYEELDAKIMAYFQYLEDVMIEMVNEGRYEDLGSIDSTYENWVEWIVDTPAGWYDESIVDSLPGRTIDEIRSEYN